MDKYFHSICHYFNYKLSHSLFLSFAEYQKEEGDYKSTKKNQRKSLQLSQKYKLFSPSLSSSSRRGLGLLFSQRLGGLFIGFRGRALQILTVGSNRWLNGQIPAAVPRPEPRFRGRILVVAPTISVAVLLQFVSHAGSSRRLGICVDDSRSGLDFWAFPFGF